MSKYLPLEVQEIIKEIRAFAAEQTISAPEEEDPAAGEDGMPAVEPVAEEPPVEEPVADPAMDAPTDPMAGGMEGELTGQEELDVDGQPIKSAKDVGRVYELKKIYSRLVAAEKILNNEPDASLVKLKKMVEKAIEMFHIVISNYKSYSDNIDEIIIAYYNFVIKLYARLRTKFKKISKEESGKEQ